MKMKNLWGVLLMIGGVAHSATIKLCDGECVLLSNITGTWKQLNSSATEWTTVCENTSNCTVIKLTNVDVLWFSSNNGSHLYVLRKLL